MIAILSEGGTLEPGLESRWQFYMRREEVPQGVFQTSEMAGATH